MATVGHFISMLGVFCFYATLLESTFERKLIPLTFNIVPRFYIDSHYLILKNIKTIVGKKKSSFPKKKIRNFFTKVIN
jgi:hypothetical protein